MRLCKNYLLLVAFYFWQSNLSFRHMIITTKSVVSLVSASAELLLFKSFTTRLGYATNCKFVSISCSSVVILVVVIFLLVICINYLFQSSHIYTSTYLYIYIFVYRANRLAVHSFCGVQRMFFS